MQGNNLIHFPQSAGEVQTFFYIWILTLVEFSVIHVKGGLRAWLYPSVCHHNVGFILTVCIELRIGRFWKWSGPPKMADHSTQAR